MIFTVFFHLLMAFFIKWRLEHFQWRLHNELAQKQKQVIDERVLRFQAEFAIESLGDDKKGIPHKPLQISTPSKSSSRVGSSSILESWPKDLTEENVRHRLKRVADLGTKERWFIDPDDVLFQPDYILGKGTFGVVVAGQVQGTQVAVKLARNICDGKQLQGVSELATELRTLRRIRHPNIVLFIGACVDIGGSNFALISELIEGPDLTACLMRSGLSLPANARCYLLLDACCALWYLHSRSPCIVHGDLKPSNVLLEQHAGRWRVKLVDFGLSRILTRHAKLQFGTLLYMAPELIHDRQNCLPCPSADIFSFGRISYVITIGWRPYEEHGVQQIRNILKMPTPPPMFWPATSLLGQKSRSIIDPCLHTVPQNRPTIAEVHKEVVTMVEDPELQTFGAGAADAPRGKSIMHMGWHAGMDHLRQQRRLRQSRPLARQSHKCSGSEIQTPSETSLNQDMPSSPRPEAVGSAFTFGTSSMSDSNIRPTPETSISMLLLRTLSRCHCSLGLHDCCQMHAAAKKFSSCLDQLQRAKCRDHGLAVAAGQCRNCMLLCSFDSDDELGDVCDFCENASIECITRCESQGRVPAMTASGLYVHL
jgi:serine/threonine protein kinase